VIRLVLLIFGLFGIAATPAHAQLAPGEQAIAVSLLPEGRGVAPGGTVTLAFVMRPRPGWHGYWVNPGDAGRPDEVRWRLPAGAAAGPLRYPVPQRLIVQGLMNYVYERDYALLAELRLPADAAPGTLLPVAARLDYLACTDRVCVPQRTDVATELRVGAPSAENRATLDGYRRALPRPLGSEARFAVANGRLRLAIPLPDDVAVGSAYFFGKTLGATDYGAEQHYFRQRQTLVVDTAAAPGAERLAEIEGVLALGDGRGVELTARPGPVPAGGEPIGEEHEATAWQIVVALLGALVGGLLLNVMPCVFPILSLKALSLARAGAEGTAKREAMAYAAGAVGMCLALGGTILALRAAGVAAGWAFQLQDPRVILLLLLLVTAVALGLAGLFRLPAIVGGDRLAGRSGARGAFWTGALAAFVATPCTGPFMGAALGAALVLPAAAALAVFGGLGLGLALPFLLLGFVPALRQRLPRPGPWMERLQRILSVPMFVTAVGLAWVLGRQAGVDGLTLGLAAALALGLSLWWLGRHGRPWLALAPAALAIGAALLLVRSEPAAPEARRGALAAVPFSEALLEDLRARQRPVFVYFTADWCLTCKVNEAAVLGRADVAAAFRRAGISVLVGDWTSGEPEIGRFLERHGRSGVPLYLFYRPGAEPEMLPQILTAARVRGLAR
jgi:thiol:disulfide interchange protein